MAIDGLHAILGRIERGEITTRAVDTPEPSVFCHELLNANPYAFLDDAPLEERRARAVTLRRTTRADADASSILNPAAIAESSWPLVRDADELHDALLTLSVVPPADDWRRWFDELVAQHRATTLQAGETPLWTCAERLPLTATVNPTAAAQPELAAPLPPSQFRQYARKASRRFCAAGSNRAVRRRSPSFPRGSRSMHRRSTPR